MILLRHIFLYSPYTSRNKTAGRMRFDKNPYGAYALRAYIYREMYRHRFQIIQKSQRADNILSNINTTLEWKEERKKNKEILISTYIACPYAAPSWNMFNMSSRSRRDFISKLLFYLYFFLLLFFPFFWPADVFHFKTFPLRNKMTVQDRRRERSDSVLKLYRTSFVLTRQFDGDKIKIRVEQK